MKTLTLNPKKHRNSALIPHNEGEHIYIYLIHTTKTPCDLQLRCGRVLGQRFVDCSKIIEILGATRSADSSAEHVSAKT